MRTLSFELRGIPVPYSIKGGQNIHTSPALKAWKLRVRQAAEAAIDEAGWVTLAGPVLLKTTLRLLRRGKVPKHGLPTGKPDLTSLIRGIEDALTDAGVWNDDNQVVNHDNAKRYAVAGAERGPEHGFVGVEVTVAEVEDGG